MTHPTSHSKQQRISFEPGSVLIHKKSFLQPFEDVLARRELESLSPGFELVEEGLFRIDQEISCEVLHRLAYFDWFQNGETYPTTQSLRERKKNGREVNRRVLRFGAHGIHEYRGKFFPQLVRGICNWAGLKTDSIVLDPMCGSGTTLAEGRALDLSCFGIDRNPLSVLISRVKSDTIGWTAAQITAAKKSIGELKFDAPSKSQLWDDADQQYLNRWFHPDALRELKGILVAINRIRRVWLCDFLRVCLSDIVRTVSHQNNDDLRVRRNEREYEIGEAEKLFKTKAYDSLESISRVLEADPNHNASYEIELGDGGQMGSIFPSISGRVDAVITSPPYATALPYIDTDRLSLVVLGLANRKGHSKIESGMIGSREISEKQRSKLWNDYKCNKNELPGSITKLVDSLKSEFDNTEVGFRRKNLPALLSKYFFDMQKMLVSVGQVLSPQGQAFFVVGNNSTNGSSGRIPIETDSLLMDLAESVGLHVHTPLNMELLASRDIFRSNRGSREQLLHFSKKSNSQKRDSAKLANRRDISTVGEEILDDCTWDFKGEKTSYFLHGLHPYPARFIPQIPRKAILQWSEPGQTILDPFCGCGTTLLEAGLNERNSIGIDNNDVATMIAKAKTSLYTARQLKRLTELVDELEDHRGISITKKALTQAPDYQNVLHWFDQQAIADLVFLRRKLKDLPARSANLGLSVLSSIIVQVSRQDSDTRYARVEKDYEPGKAIKLWRRKMLKMCDVSLEQSEVLSKKTSHKIYRADSRNLKMLDDSSVDLLVTSPPYINAYDYHKYHRHRFHWLDFDFRYSRDTEIGKHDYFTRKNADPSVYFNDLKECLSEWKRVLVKEGRCVVVIGDGIVHGNLIPSGDELCAIASSLGYSVERRWVRKIDPSKKSFNAASRMKREHVLLFKA